MFILEMICVIWDDILLICLFLHSILNLCIFKDFFLVEIRITVKMNTLARIQMPVHAEQM